MKTLQMDTPYNEQGIFAIHHPVLRHQVIFWGDL